MRTWAKQEFFIIPMGSLKRSKGETARLQINNGSRLHSYFENWKPHNHNERFYFVFYPFFGVEFQTIKIQPTIRVRTKTREGYFEIAAGFNVITGLLFVI